MYNLKSSIIQISNPKTELEGSTNSTNFDTSTSCGSWCNSNKNQCNEFKLKNCLGIGQEESTKCKNLIPNIKNISSTHVSKLQTYCSRPGKMGPGSLCQRIALKNPAGFLDGAVAKYCKTFDGQSDPLCGCSVSVINRQREDAAAANLPPAAINQLYSSPGCTVLSCTSSAAYKSNGIETVGARCPPVQVCNQSINVDQTGSAAASSTVKNLNLSCGFNMDGSVKLPNYSTDSTSESVTPVMVFDTMNMGKHKDLIIILLVLNLIIIGFILAYYVGRRYIQQDTSPVNTWFTSVF